MTDKNHSLDCLDCGGSYFVTEDRAHRRECPNCHSANVDVLD